MPSLHQRIIEHVQAHQGLSATEIAKALREPAASVSSILYAGYKAGYFQRVDGYGPRGGCIYFMAENLRKRRPLKKAKPKKEKPPSPRSRFERVR